MIKIITQNISGELNKLLERNAFRGFTQQQAVVQKIIKAVAQEGDAALLRFTKQFDKAALKKADIKLDPMELELAHSQVPSGVLVSLRTAIKNITQYNLKQVPKSWAIAGPAGSEVGLRYSPLDSVGVYVPGGKAAYFSTVLMNVIPAKVAGVRRIALVTPTGKDGKVNNLILAAAKELGVQEVYRVGGAQAVAALALGTKTIPAVDKIVGPGNIYVTLAKQLVSSFVGIDKLAGPSDSVIVADDSVPAKIVAADLVTQAEHDVLASSILITTSKQLAKNVSNELHTLLKKLSRAVVIKEAFSSRGAIFVVPTPEQAISMVNKIAPEHLELLVQDPRSWFNKVENAGAVFLGQYSPQALGDYLAGPNHVLPTGGTARFASPLSVADFIKATSLIDYTAEGLKAVSYDVQKLARLEGFDGHAAAIEARQE